MSTYAHAYFFKNKKSLKQFQVDINKGYGWEQWKNHPSVIKSTFHHFSVALRVSDLDALKPKDECDENDINILREGFKETKAKFVFIG